MTDAPTVFADISHHQQTVDLAAYAKAGHTRVVLKATEGTGFTDPAFADRWQQAGQLGLARVAYHFARVGWPGSVQFDFLYATVNAAGGLGPHDRLCLDAEDIDTANAAKLAPANAKAFAARAAAQGVGEGLVYSYRYYLNNYGIRPDLFPAGWQQLWLADYTAGQADGDIELGGGWQRSEVVARQYTDQETVAGVAGTCDASRVLADWLPKPPQPKPPTPPEATMGNLTDDDKAWLRALTGAGGSTTVTGVTQSTYNLLHADLADVQARLARIEDKLNQPAPPVA